MNRKRQWAVALVVATTLATAGCSLNEGGSPRTEQTSSGSTTLHIGTTTDVTNFNPFQTLSKTDNWILNAMYPHLQRVDENAKKVPELAESYKYIDGGKTAVFTLRKDFTWSDGKPVTSKDVKFSAESIMKYKLGNVAAKLQWVQSIETPDDTTVVFHLSQAYATFAEGISFWMPIVPEHVYAPAGDLTKFTNDQVAGKWVGAGAYVLDSYTKGQRYVMKANDTYPYAPAGGAKVKTIEYVVYPDVNTMTLALRNGEIDLMAPPVSASAAASLKNDKNITLQKVGSLGYADVTYNVQKGDLAKQEVRQALSMVVDTRSMISTILQGLGKPIVGPVSPIFGEYYNTDLKAYPFDPAAARKMLEADGYKDADNNKMLDGLTFTMICDGSNPNMTRVAEVVHGDAAKAGIDIKATCAERNTFLSQMKGGDYDIVLSEHSVYDNPMDQLRSVYLSTNPGGINYNHVNDPALDQLITDAAGTVDHAAIVPKIKEIAKYVHDQALLEPLYVQTFNFAYRSDRFTGFEPSPSDLLGMVTGYSLAQVKPVS